MEKRRNNNVSKDSLNERVFSSFFKRNLTPAINLVGVFLFLSEIIRIFVVDMKRNINIINKKAKFEYEFIQNYICGIVLMGSEVKSIREGRVSLNESYCVFMNNELFLKNTNISELKTSFGHTATQDRKLLLKKQELKKLKKELVKGLTIIPYRVFINEQGFVKVEIALARGKKIHDKRESLKLKDIERDIKKQLKH